jgi:hypothetical protein
MSISFQALEAACSEIESLGHDEIGFPVGNTMITMRTLLPEEEQEVQKYASRAWSDDDDENAAGETLDFVDRFRVDTIARAIVQVGDQDLRGVEEIPTGETLDNGVPIREPRHLSLRRLVNKWGGPIRFVIFKKYTEMLRHVETKAMDAVKFEPSDYDTEIKRLKDRIEELEARKEGEEETYDNPAYTVASYGEMDRGERQKALDKTTQSPEPPTPEKAAEPPVSPPSPVLGPTHTTHRESPRQPITPQAATPPPEQPAPSQQEPPAPDDQENVFDGGSFVASDDMAVAAARENARLFAARQAADGGPNYPQAESVLSAVHETLQPPPHVAAAHAAAGLLAEEESRQAELRGKTADGVEVYSLQGETVDLTPKAPQPPAPAPASPGKGTQNPRFRRARGR